MQDIHKILKQTFGFDSFREWQEKIITSIIEKNDTLVFMPTGWWKSLTYQLPAIALDGLAIVISPLISLMKDQLDSLNNLWVRAEVINSTISYLDQQNILNEISRPDSKIKFLYIAPERLNSENFLRVIKQVKISLIAIDEAHCVSQWWHDFRPSYMKIKGFIKELKEEQKIPIIALTATATKKVKEDIILRLWLENPNIFTTWFDRKNITIVVREISKADEKRQKIIEVLNSIPWSGIVYCSSRKKTQEVYDFLVEQKVSVWIYMWSMNPDERKLQQDNFMEWKYRVIVATNAFGMWIDKKDIRFVIHYNLPWSIENYYQEVWRAWRDWKHSFWVVLASYWDTKIQEFFIENTYPEKQEVLDFYDYLYKNIKLWEWIWTEILKTYFLMSQESNLWSDMKVSSIVKILEKYWVIKRWYNSDNDSDFRGRGITLAQEKRNHNHLLIDRNHQKLLENEAYYKLEQIKQLLFYPSCRKKFILDYFWDEEDLKKLWDNCKTCDFCIEMWKKASWKSEKLVQLSVFSIVLDVVDLFDKRFWIKLITAFLRGSKEKRILEWGLNKKSEYGILSEYNSDLIEALVEALIRQWFIEKTTGQYPTIWLTDKWRVALSREYLLKDEENELQSYLSMRVKSSSYKKIWKEKTPKKSGNTNSAKWSTQEETLKLFKSWKTILEIAEERWIKDRTVEEHILSLYSYSKLWLNDILKLVNFFDIEFIKKLLDNEFKNWVEKLREVKDRLEELWKKDISYFEIKACIAMIENRDI